MSLRPLRAAPVTAPGAVAIGLLGWMAADDGGYAITVWAPVLIVVLALLLGAVLVIPNTWSAVPRPVLGAAVLLGAYVAWSWLSVVWADDPGAAWEGATRSALYLAIFCLLALWLPSARGGELLVGGWVVVLGAVALVTLVRIGQSDAPGRFFGDDRLLDPAGYPNATAGLLTMCALPAVVLAAGSWTHWLLRALWATAAVILLDTALLALSRGMLFALPLALIVLLTVVPGRMRNLAAAAVIGLGGTAAAPAVLDVGHALLADGGSAAGAAHSAVLAILSAALVTGAVVGTVARWETRRPPSPARREAITRAGSRVTIAAACLGAVGALIVAGNPVDRLDSAWGSFKGGYGDNRSTGSRLTGGLGSNRYDFYRVGLNVFADHPLIGIGVDNFQAEYLRHGTSSETPRYPHSLQVRTLAETGVVGALLLLGALGCALLAAWRAMRGPNPLGRTVAGAAFIGVAYFLLHGSVDWFFEFAGLGAGAFALLGIACAFAPRDPEARDARTLARVSPIALAGVVAVTVALGGVALALWAGERDIERAAAVFDRRPGEALDRLDRAASLHPFSGAPDALAGSILLRVGDLRQADAAFARVLDRVPDDQYATLERGAIASATGHPAAARRLLARAAALAPRDPLAAEALQIVRDGASIDIAELNRRILQAARAITG